MTDTDRLAEERAAMDDCDTRPIHDIGLIQDFGCLITTDLRAKRVLRASENTGEILGVSVGSVLGADPVEPFSRDTVHAIRNAAAHPTIADQRETVALHNTPAGAVDLSIFVSGDEVVIEAEPRAAGAPDPLSATSTAQRAVARLVSATEPQKLLRSSCEELRSLTGFDRVKAYRLLPDGAGEVVAESLVPGVDSFLGLRFPATDVPQTARRVFSQASRRNIRSVGAEPVPILDGQSDLPPLDLTLSVLRGVAPVHLVYLRNMGVQASMSLPIIVDGRLWGLFALHHRTEYVPDAPTGAAAEIVARAVSLQLTHLESLARRPRERECATVAASLFAADDSPLGVRSLFSTNATGLYRLWECDGVALVGQERVEVHGDTPPADTITAIVRRVTDGVGFGESGASAGDRGRSPLSTTEASTLVPDASLGPTAGVLVLPHPLPTFTAIVVCRNARPRELRWAGDPAKQVERIADEYRLNPRASFADYVETVSGTGDDWTADDLVIAQVLQDALERSPLGTALTDRDNHRQGLIVRELNHRVRNVLALVQSLINQTGTDVETVTEYVDGLSGRVRALADAHRLVTGADWHEIDLVELAHAVLDPFRGVTRSLDIEGPRVRVTADLASLLSLVFYEMATNAVKHGAWSVPGGLVTCRWGLGTDGTHLTWVESDGPPVGVPEREGFGLSMIRDSLSFEFGATASVDFDRNGLRVSVLMPSGAGPLDDGGTSRLGRALVVEDDFVIGREIVGVLRGLGVSEVLAAPTVAAALEIIADSDLDFAVLDANLRGEFSGPVAEQLAVSQVPFVYVTGYGSNDEQLLGLGARAVFSKPIDEARLAAIVSETVWKAT